VVVMIDSPAGAVNAALIPVTNREAISTPPVVAMPPRPEATVNTLSDARNTRRRPKLSAACPPTSKKPA
jgi:hypothetical protein